MALLTDRKHPGLTADDRLLAATLQARGCVVTAAQWTDPIPGFDLAVVRSCWDYHASPRRFLDALELWQEHCRVVNPVDTVRWNLDKRYLLELQAAGVTIPNTVLVPAGDSRSFNGVLAELGAVRAVVKPVIGASGIDTWLSGSDRDRSRWDAGAERDRLVQRYVPEVTTGGELSLIHFSDGYSHAVVKKPAPGEFRVQEDHGGTVIPVVADHNTIEATRAVLQAVGQEWEYARVDGVVVEGEFVIMELELIEPDLFFRINPAATDRLAAVILG